MTNLLKKLAQYLAYHSSVGFADCNDLPGSEEPDLIETGTSEADLYFIIEQAGHKFSITIKALD
jgi:hypothetical protein